MSLHNTISRATEEAEKYKSEKSMKSYIQEQRIKQPLYFLMLQYYQDGKNLENEEIKEEIIDRNIDEENLLNGIDKLSYDYYWYKSYYWYDQFLVKLQKKIKNEYKRIEEVRESKIQAEIRQAHMQELHGGNKNKSLEVIQTIALFIVVGVIGFLQGFLGGIGKKK